MVMGLCERLFYLTIYGLDIVKDVFPKQDSIDETDYIIVEQDK